ncbi:MAG TPA: RsmB/NOP family class I SAM-dependent RNA methyltransferase [Bauldia sp.]|nr:RsmB/NOP family class I SAM-dependent RNA methyltransferase [Bauldia sp.]
MTPGARLAAAIEILADIEARHRPVAEALKDWGVSHRFAGSKDRAAIGNAVYDALRWRLSSAWVMSNDSPRALVLATVGRRWGLGSVGLDTAIAGDPHAPSPLTTAEKALIDLADLAAAPAHVKADIPEWLAPRLERAFAEEWVAEGEALALRPPLDMRANRLKADREKVARALAQFGATPTTLAPDGLRIPPTEKDGRHPNVQVEPAFQKGWFEIQDEGSQIASHLVAAKPGEQVLDLCAGAGGKTLAIAAAMENKGQLFATDSDRTRLAPIFDRLKRAGTRNVQVRPAGAPLDDLHGRMDAVLLDVPCTGTGVWRRRPDAKWRLSERALGDRVADQRRLIDQAVHYLKPGGRLIYVTCSILPDENSDQVAALAERMKGIVITSPESALQATGMSDSARATLQGALAPGGLLLSPRRTGTDGFFVAVLRKEH